MMQDAEKTHEQLLRELTALRQQNAALQAFKAESKQAEERFRLAVESAPNAMVLVNREGQIVLVNSHTEDIFGYPRTELIGQSIEILIPARFRSRHAELHKRFVADPTMRFMGRGRDLYGLRKDGSEFPVEIGLNPIDSDEGNLVLSAIVDITERKQAEEALRLIQFAIDQSPDATFWMGPDARFLYVNQTACHALGYTREELLAMTLYDIDSEFPPEVWSQHWQRIKHGIPLIYTSHHRTKDDRLFPVEITANYLEFNGYEYSCAFARDITERKRLEDQLRQSQKMQAIGTLAGGIAHEFNNLLAVILGFTEMAAYHIPHATPAYQHLQEVLTAGKRAKDLVQQILTFSRKSSQERVPVQLPQLVKEALTLLRASLPTTIAIRQRIAPDTGTVLVDATQMHQVLMNLCANAEHAMRETGGVLEIGVDCVEVDEVFAALQPTLHPGPHVRVTVKDTGHGIAPEVMERIFEPFFTTKGVGEGTGMGLALVHGIVTNHDGTITLQSTLGEGTTFDIYLPRIPETVGNCDRPEAPLSYGRGCILFVDDEVSVARLGQTMLEQLGYDVVAQTGSVEALAVFRTMPQRFDLVITDQTMPNMTGEHLASELRHIRSDIPIILCTGFSHVIHAEKAQALGIDAFLMKPLVARDMAETIRQVLKKRSRQAS